MIHTYSRHTLTTCTPLTCCDTLPIPSDTAPSFFQALSSHTHTIWSFSRTPYSSIKHLHITVVDHDRISSTVHPSSHLAQAVSHHFHRKLFVLPYTLSRVFNISTCPLSPPLIVSTSDVRLRPASQPFITILLFISESYY